MAVKRRRGRAGPMLGMAVAGIILTAAATIVLQGRQVRPEANTPGAVVIGTAIGNGAPDFRVVDTNGGTVTRASLTVDKPGLIFFTATWCLPCIEGLRHLARFQQDVSGMPFNVLVVFVDPRETNDDLRVYRERWSFPAAWHYALNRDEMVVRYGIRYLDTKFVLDRDGVIRYADVRPADYDTWRRALATVGVAP